MKTAIKPSSRAPEITRVVSPEGTIICEKAGHQASAGLLKKKGLGAGS